MELIIIFVIICYILRGQSITNFDVTVAQDGSGNYSRIMDVISAAPIGRTNRYFIKIKEGNYTEYVAVDQNHTNLTFIGDRVEKTTISGSKGWGRDHISTYETATVAIKGYSFVAMDITFENTAGPENEQAVVLVSDVDSSFYCCKFVGYQDTLYARHYNQFYRECDIYGTIDFVFGDTSAVFQNCNIYARFPGEGRSNAVTAQGREEFNGRGGTVIQNCTITATEDLHQKRSTIKAYLGRPWKNFSRTVFMQSFLDDVLIQKDGLNGKEIGLTLYTTESTTTEDLVQILAEESIGKDITDSGNDLIESTCKTTVDPDLCVKILRSDPRSSSADVKGLAHIMLEVASAYCNDTFGQIKKMLNKTKISDRPIDKFMRDHLQLCFEMYDSGVNNIQNAIQKLRVE
ncbi:hypothetical protein Q3G72_030344 [Acer saccharum]|nr:hypothetical protein Q3G72_030344 [Acer saccharum]